MLSKRKASYDKAEFAKDIVGSSRLTGVTNTGVGMQKLVATVKAKTENRPGPPPVSGGVQRARPMVPSGVRTKSTSPGVTRVDLNNSESSGEESMHTSLVSSNRLHSESESSFQLVGKNGKDHLAK